MGLGRGDSYDSHRLCPLPHESTHVDWAKRVLEISRITQGVDRPPRKVPIEGTSQDSLKCRASHSFCRRRTSLLLWHEFDDAGLRLSETLDGQPKMIFAPICRDHATNDVALLGPHLEQAASCLRAQRDLCLVEAKDHFAALDHCGARVVSKEGFDLGNKWGRVGRHILIVRY